MSVGIHLVVKTENNEQIILIRKEDLLKNLSTPSTFQPFQPLSTPFINPINLSRQPLAKNAGVISPTARFSS
jgi:hypothetical protein